MHRTETRFNMQCKSSFALHKMQNLQLSLQNNNYKHTEIYTKRYTECKNSTVSKGTSLNINVNNCACANVEIGIFWLVAATTLEMATLTPPARLEEASCACVSIMAEVSKRPECCRRRWEERVKDSRWAGDWTVTCWEGNQSYTTYIQWQASYKIKNFILGSNIDV